MDGSVSTLKRVGCYNKEVMTYSGFCDAWYSEATFENYEIQRKAFESHLEELRLEAGAYITDGLRDRW